MPFLLPNQQHQSTENATDIAYKSEIQLEVVFVVVSQL